MTLRPTLLLAIVLILNGDFCSMEHASAVVSTPGSPPVNNNGPPGDGLVLWLDPSQTSTVGMDASRRIESLLDCSGGHHDANSSAARPELTLPDSKGRSMLHFAGKEEIDLSAIRAVAGGVSIFVVYDRGTDRKAPAADSSLVISHPDLTQAEDASPNFIIASPSEKAPSRSISTVALENRPIGPITLGRGYCGDIGEILVYDHVFTSEGDRQAVLEYLRSKWDCAVPQLGWLRDGPLGPKIVRTRNDLPLSDQANNGRWTLDPTFTDEFKEKEIDTTRWHLYHSGDDEWWGRKPGLFLPKNVTLENGALNIRQDKGTPDELKGHDGYAYTTGYITTIDRTGYGYYEVEARPARSEFDCAFWFTDTGDPNNGLEIDVFEMGSHTKYYHNQDTMTVHVWGENGDKRHWGSLAAYTTPWEVADDFHVYGLEWTKADITWYIDGYPVRKVPNTNWHLPQRLVFDSEPMLDWFGPIDATDFPANYTIKYLRVWRQADDSFPVSHSVPPPKSP